MPEVSDARLAALRGLLASAEKAPLEIKHEMRQVVINNALMRVVNTLLRIQLRGTTNQDDLQETMQDLELLFDTLNVQLEGLASRLEAEGEGWDE